MLSIWIMALTWLSPSLVRKWEVAADSLETYSLGWFNLNPDGRKA